jgi:hypothetical protein
MMPREGLTEKKAHIASFVWQGLTNHEIGKLTGATEPL